MKCIHTFYHFSCVIKYVASSCAIINRNRKRNVAHNTSEASQVVWKAREAEAESETRPGGKKKKTSVDTARPVLSGGTHTVTRNCW